MRLTESKAPIQKYKYMDIFLYPHNAFAHYVFGVSNEQTPLHLLRFTVAYSKPNKFKMYQIIVK